MLLAETFAALPADVHAAAVAALRPRVLRKQQFIVQEGERVPCDCFVQRGVLRSYFLDADGKEHILQFATEGWWISDYDAFFAERPARLWVECLTPCEVFAITLADCRRLCAVHPTLAANWSKKLEGGFVALQRRILEQLTDDAGTRYRSFVDRYPGLVQRIPKRLVAGYLGVSRETLSRL